tara:strand:+ start:60 stop:470 length:411 start_codon:yes stop_codon:yes gene_type:complete
MSNRGGTCTVEFCINKYKISTVTVEVTIPTYGNTNAIFANTVKMDGSTITSDSNTPTLTISQGSDSNNTTLTMAGDEKIAGTQPIGCLDENSNYGKINEKDTTFSFYGTDCKTTDDPKLVECNARIAASDTGICTQ